MAAKRALLCIMIACLVGSAASCSRGKKEKSLESQSDLVARVGEFRITQEQMRERFDGLPDKQKNDFKGPEGQAKFVDRLIEEHLLYLAALDAKIDKDETVKDRLRWLTMNLLIGEYITKEVAGKIKIEPEEIDAYYKAHPQEFQQAAILRAQYAFTTDSLKAARWQRRLAKGEDFSKIAKNESEDKATASDSGVLGYFNPGGYIKSIGFSDIFSKAVEKLEPNVVSPIIHFEKGFALVKVLEKNPSRSQTLEQARSTIEGKVRAEKSKVAYSLELDRLRKKYSSENYVMETLKKTTRTPEELWEMARLEEDPRARIQYYRDIVNMYPTHKNAPQALFMIGFVYAEDLNDQLWARRTFDELMQKYPQSEMVESAKWMIDNMQTTHTKIGSFEGMQEKMKEDKAKKAGGKK